MKIQKLLKGIFAAVASVCMAMGICCVAVTPTKADDVTFTDVDITEKIAITRVQKTDDKNYLEFYVNAGESVGAYIKGTSSWDGGGKRWVLNGSTADDVKAAGCDLLSYIEINGKDVRTILGEAGTTYGTFNKGDEVFDAYTPVMVNAEGLFIDGFHIMISKAYIQEINDGKLDGWTLTFKSGIVWNTVNTHALKTFADVTWEYVHGQPQGSFDKDFVGEQPTYTDVDITEKIAITRVLDTRNKNYVEFYVNVGESVGAYVYGFNSNPKTYPGLGRRWVLNGSSVRAVAMAGCDLLSYIEINGKDVRTILDEAGTAYGTFDKGDAVFDAYTPVMMNAEGLFVDGFHLMISKDYIRDVNEGSLDNWTLTLKNGIVWNTVNSHALKTSADVTRTYYKGVFITEEEKGKIKPTVDKDITATTTVSLGSKEDYNRAQVYIDFGADIQNILPVFINQQVVRDKGFYVNDHGTDYASDVDMMEYILLNGRTLRSIVQENARTYAYKGETFPLTYSGQFAPVAVFIGETHVRLDIMKDYCAWQDIRITLKNGFMWTVKGDETNNYLLKWTENITYAVESETMVKYGGDETVDLGNGLKVAYVANEGDYRRYAISFAETFNAEKFAVTGGTGAASALQDVITVNGKTVRTLNAETADTVRAELACTDGKSSIELWINKNYTMQTPVEKIGLKAFDWEFVSLKHSLEKEIAFRRIDGIYKRIYLVTFDGGEAIEAVEGSVLPEERIPENPTKENTAETEYVFKGWYYQYKDGLEYLFEADKFAVLSDMDLYPKFVSANRKYTVTLLKEDGAVYATQEIAHGATIELQDVPVKEYYTGKWAYEGDGEESVQMPIGNITYKLQYTATEYTVTFYKNSVGTEVLATETYTIENKNITAPDVPEKMGYAGTWSVYELNGGNVEVRPVYVSKRANGGCGATLFGLPVVGLATLVCVVASRKKKENRL